MIKSQKSTTTTSAAAVASQPAQSSSGNVVDLSHTRKTLKSTTKELSKSFINLTPRKRSLALKSSSENTSNAIAKPNSDKFVKTMKSNTKLNSKSTKPSIFNPPVKSVAKPSIDESAQGGQLDNLDPTQKNTLFQFSDTKIMSFDNLDDNENDEKGRLLGIGKFEIFQLHQNKVSYLQCGKVIHPILPRLKILKISKNQFILPLLNPERYWRIILQTDDENVLQDLETSFQKICQFRNLVVKESAPVSTVSNVVEQIEKKLQTGADHGTTCKPLIKSTSNSSISTTLACLGLESNSINSTNSTNTLDLFLDELDSQTKSNIPTTKDNILINEEMIRQDLADTTIYFTPEPSMNEISLPSINDISTMNNTSKLGNKNSIIFDQSILSKSSHSTSLYTQESSWMDPIDGPILSTPNKDDATKYILLNLNPNPNKNKVSSPLQLEKKLSEPLFNLSREKINKNRYSSYDIYNILQDVEDDFSPQEKGLVTGFIKSFF